MKKYLHYYKIQILSILIIFCISILLLFYLKTLYNTQLDIPIIYNGQDEFTALSNSKTIKDTGWIFKNPYLGAPFGMEYYDYPSFFLNNFDNLILKVLVLFTSSSVLAVNLQFLLLFPLISIISYLTMRSLGINNTVSILCSLTFAFSPYIYVRGMSHMTLSTYEFVPLSILICLWIFQDDKFFIINRKFFLYKKNIYAIIMLILIANNGMAYYPYFTCFFILVSGIISAINKKNIQKIYASLTQVLLIIITIMIELLPVMFYLRREGTNISAVIRSRGSGETYGLKIIQLFLPLFSHGNGYLEKIIKGYRNDAPLVNENISSYLGLIGIVGFIILIFMIYYNKSDSELVSKLKALSLLNISAILLATIGGISSIICFFITTKIRGYNRISIFIMYICILAVAYILTFLYEKIKNKKIFIITIIALFSFAIWEQFSNGPHSYELNKFNYETDKAFVKKVENSVSLDAKIFQLPYHQYPEGGIVNSMADYQLLTGYLHSDNLRWSYGGIKGRKSDIWNKMISDLDTKTMVKALSIAGFEGIYIDRRAYTDTSYNELDNAITEVLNVSPIISDNGNLVFFNMASFNKTYYNKYTDDEIVKLKNELINFVGIGFGNGFYGVEESGHSQRIWMSQEAELIINNYSEKEIEYELNFSASTGYNELSSLEIIIDKNKYNYEINANARVISQKILLKPGKNKIKFISYAIRVNAPEDPRKLYVKVTDFDFNYFNYKFK